MMQGIKNGFFDETMLTNEIGVYLKSVDARRAQLNLEKAWHLFHASFKADGEDVAAQIYKGCKDNIKYLSSMNLDSAFSLLRTLGEKTKAQDLLEYFITIRGDEDIFDVKKNPFGREIKDEAVLEAFAEQLKKQPLKAPTALEAATRIYKGGWNPADEEVLANLSIAEFTALFKSLTDTDRSVLIYGALTPLKFSNPTKIQETFAKNAKSALISIGKESLLNQLRLKAFGIEFFESDEVDT